MGHYASDMPGWEEHLNWVDERIKMRDRVSQAPLSIFKGKHYPMLHRLYGLGHISNQASKQDMIELDQLLSEYGF